MTKYALILRVFKGNNKTTNWRNKEMTIKIFTHTEEYMVLFVNGELRKFDMEYHNNRKYVTIDGGLYWVSEME